MNVEVAACAGMCYGVKRALDLAEEVAARGQRAQTLGPLIHNPHVVEALAARGVTVAESPEDVRAPVVIIRSHGAGPQVHEQLASGPAQVVDATCPHVLRAQKAARALAGTCAELVVVGEPGHAEVEGLRAWAQGRGARVIVAAGPEDLPADLKGPVGVVVQTTQQRAVLEHVTGEMSARGLKLHVRDTICDATADRQQAAADLAARADAMVVVGGRNSSNTTRLAEVCSARCPRTFHVESPDEAANLDLAGAALVGVTAGASTPQAHIDAVVAALGRR